MAVWEVTGFKRSFLNLIGEASLQSEATTRNALRRLPRVRKDRSYVFMGSVLFRS